MLSLSDYLVVLGRRQKPWGTPRSIQQLFPAIAIMPTTTGRNMGQHPELSSRLYPVNPRTSRCRCCFPPKNPCQAKYFEAPPQAIPNQLLTPKENWRDQYAKSRILKDRSKTCRNTAPDQLPSPDLTPYLSGLYILQGEGAPCCPENRRRSRRPRRRYAK